MGDLLRGLDSDSLQEVLSRCESDDLLRLMQTCKTLYEILYSSTLVWCNRLWVDFGWETFPGERSDFMLYRSIYQQESAESIRFRGLFTDGGIDDANTSYWVDNVFIDDISPYCSHASANIDLVGVLLKHSELTRSKERSIRQYLISRCRYAAALLEHIHARDRTESFRERLRTIESYSDLQLKLFFFSLHDSFHQDSQLGQLLFYNVTPDNLEEEQRRMTAIRQHLLSIETFQDQNIIGKDSDVVYDGDILQKIEQSEMSMCILERMVISREGQLTCPVSCGAIFGCAVSRHGAMRSEADLLELMRKSLHDISDFNSLDSFRMLCEKSEKGLVPAFNRVCFQEKNVFVEFKRVRLVSTSGGSCDKLFQWFPIGWFQFALYDADFDSLVRNREGYQACDVLFPCDFENEDTVAESRIFVPLKMKHAINFVAVKLISQENRMDAMMDGHDWPNIDLSSLTLQGRIIDV
mmetsp:Transcript_9992/g.19687  ORF Transcript_9992/g.19687 Transcript_9992/m.19687 type:complete len:467 (+) Transcript_9992:69-1469(+)